MTTIPIRSDYLLPIILWAEENRIGYIETFTPMHGATHVLVPSDRVVEFRLRWGEAIVEEAP